MSEKISGWESKPKWKTMEAGPHNNNALIDKVLKPLKEELINVLRILMKDVEKKVKR